MSEFLGKTIGEYQLVEFAAENEHTLVYKGFQLGTNNYVFITVLKPHFARDATNAQRFLQAAQLGTQFHHPNILPVYASGQAEGLVYRVTPFVEGGTLRESRAWFQETNAMLELFKQITTGLEYIHAQGFVHGNLKSSTTYLDPQRYPLLSDIGVSVISGTIPDAYLSPEQAQGGIVDKRSDVYAQGVLLYEVLVGEAPPPGMVVSLRARRPDLPESIERVILKAMAQNPDQRFQSAAEFQTTLQTAVHSPAQVEALPHTASTPAPAVSQNVQVSQPKGTNWVAIILGTLLVAVLCGGFTFLVLPNLGDGQESEQPLPTEPAPPPEQPPEQPPPEQPPEQPPPDQPPEQLPAEPPEQLPGEPSEPPGFELPEVCGSVGGVGGLVLVSVLMARKRRDLP